LALIDTATGQERLIAPPEVMEACGWHQRHPLDVTERHAVWMMAGEDGVSHRVFLKPVF
jgi:hypothetical protein